MTLSTPAGAESKALVCDALRLRAIAEGDFQLLIEFDPDGGCVYASPNHQQLLGRAGKALQGSEWLEVVCPEDRHQVREALRSARETGASLIAARLAHSLAGWRWFEGSLTAYSAASGDLRILGQLRDVEGVRQDEERFRILRESFQDLLAEIDQRGVIVLASPTHESLSGYPPEKLVGSPLVDYLHPDDLPQVARLLEQAPLAGGRRLRFRFRHADGGWRWIECTALGFRNTDGENHILGISRDVSESVALEDALREAQQRTYQLATGAADAREMERSRVAREIHDELGQGLTALRLRLSSLRNKPDSDLEMLDRTISDVDDLVASVRRIGARLLPPSLEQLGVVAAIESCARNLADAAGWRLHMDLAPHDPGIDEQRGMVLFRVAQEALTNIARHAGASRAEVRLEIADHRLVLSVSDDGRGIPPDSLNSPRSIGLGGMRERAASLGGSLTIDSASGTGTCVRLEVPRSSRAQGASPDAA